ncbi:tetratricopeptide repeat protein [Streptomyces sp. NBC_01306]|uniref:ATP-binding protein n=1 Tax=Streptomyces sp. NBC_01306 TaxID=2903819 RepID=UPI002250D27C|nr:tetratricopeptide repeat protein [Streptomyces sp. NBC_01306]MCX4724835.1 tetratricopeptide repeat protein [Streptomyces sp. NBC_01306]
MEPVTAARLATVLGRVDDAAWQALADLLPGQGLPRRPPTDPVGTAALAEALAAAAAARQELGAALRLWLTAVPMTNSIGGEARVEGTVVQARDIKNVHVHQLTPPPHRSGRPRQLIPGPAHFTGRTPDLAALEALRTGHPGVAPPTVVVTGAAGVGKTALAAHWLNAVAGEYPDGQLYVDLRGHARHAALRPGEALGQFLRAFGIDHVPAELAEQAALWRTVTADLRVAVMLDNALSAAQVRPLLPAGPGALVVVTSRRRLPGLTLDGASFHQLDGLAIGSAVELLSHRLGGGRVAGEPAAAHRLAESCSGLPLAVCVAAARIAARPQQSLASLAAAMSRSDDRLGALNAGGERAVQTALDDSYRTLSAGAARGYRRLGLLPVGEFGPLLAAASCALSAEEAERVLDELIEVNLIEELGSERWRFHDLVRLHAAQRAAAEDTPGTRDETVRRTVDWYLRTATEARALLSPTHRTLRRDYAYEPVGLPTPFSSAEDALRWLDSERLHLMTALRAAVEHGWSAPVWQLADSMQPLFLRLRPYDLWIEAHRYGLAAARLAGHPDGESRMLTTGGSGLYNAGHYDEAVRWFTRALHGARRDADRRAEAQALHGLGQSHRLAGRLDRATGYFTEALALREKIGYVRGAALSRLCLGDIALATGDPHRAVVLLTRARSDLLAVPDPYDAARALAFLGRARAADGIADFAAADRQLLLALDEFAATGSVHWQGRVLEMLGECAEDRGDRRAAAARYRQSLARYAPVSPGDTRRLQERLRALDAG